MKLIDGVTASADLSACGTYRYALRRVWDQSKQLVLWVMLNPSTADAEMDDPTIRRCQDFACQWGYGGIVVANLFALRATDPRELERNAEPVGVDNDAMLTGLATASDTGLVVCGWGAHGTYRNRAWNVATMLREAGVDLHMLALTVGGQPRHPLYLRAGLNPILWKRASSAVAERSDANGRSPSQESLDPMGPQAPG